MSVKIHNFELIVQASDTEILIKELAKHRSSHGIQATGIRTVSYLLNKVVAYRVVNPGMSSEAIEGHFCLL
jgi:hypothetical protein